MHSQEEQQESIENNNLDGVNLFPQTYTVTANDLIFDYRVRHITYTIIS